LKSKKPSRRPTVTVPFLAAFDDPQLLGPHAPSFGGWRTVSKVMDGLPLTPKEHELYVGATGRTKTPKEPVTELWVVGRRRDGKSYFTAARCTWKAAFIDYSSVLSPGELGVLLIVATDKRQGQVILDYIRGFLQRSPMLRQLITSETRETIELRDRRVRIEVRSPDYRRLRGITIVDAACDEIAFWRSEDRSYSPDAAVLAAIRPAMATIATASLLCASTPYSRTGELFRTFERFYGKKEDDPRVLVWWSNQVALNPTIDARVIEDALERDPVAAQSEWYAGWRADVETFAARDRVEAVVPPGVAERAPVPGQRYVGGLDAAGGSGSDAIAMAIAHGEQNLRVLDVVLERRPPFSPAAVVAEFAEVFRRYGVTTVQADTWGGGFVVEAFKAHGIQVEPVGRTKSEVFIELLPAINSGQVSLLDQPRLIAQLLGLERRAGRSGRDAVDHGPGGHDDAINAAGIALVGVKMGARLRPFAWKGPGAGVPRSIDFFETNGAPAPTRPVAPRFQNLNEMKW
jgi:hypothetical protein